MTPNSPETLLALGYYQYWVLFDNEAARATFEHVGKLLPGSSEVPFALAYVFRREGHWKESVAQFEQALTLDPRNVELLDDAGETYALQRQFATARKLFDRVLDITPTDLNVTASKVSLYQAEGNLQEAARFLSGISESSPQWAFDTKIRQLRLERNYDEAVRLLQARLAQFHYPTLLDKSRHQVTLAVIQRLAGDAVGAKIIAEQARNALEQLDKNQPGSPYIAVPLSNAYAVIGEKDLALNLADRAIMFLRDRKDLLKEPGMEENLAMLQTMFGENSSAISILSKLLQTSYDSWVHSWVITPALLRLEPIWDPLRSDPAFRKLCEEKQK